MSYLYNKSHNNKILLILLILISPFIRAQAVNGNNEPQWQHALSIGDQPVYPAGFSHFNTVNPEAPKGGQVSFSIHGSFDSLNPYILKGSAPAAAPNVYRYGVMGLNEPLMIGMDVYAPAQEEVGTLYGLIASAVSLSADRQILEFKLRPEARFHDQHPITSEDVLFTFELLKAHGAPHYKMLLEQIDSIEAPGTHHIRYRLKPPVSRTLPLHVAELPVLPKHYWQKRNFSQTTLDPPLLSGPYRTTKVKPGTSVMFERVKDYWGKNLPVNRGFYNFDRITLNFYRDRRIAFESFRSGDADAFIEAEAKNWAKGYDLPAVKAGDIIKQEVPCSIPGKRLFYLFNQRNPLFKDRRTRQAISMLFDWQWTNNVLFHGAYARNLSFFPVSGSLAEKDITNQEKKILEPFTETLPKALFNQPFKLVGPEGNGNIERERRMALRLLKQAGWQYRNGQLVNQQGEPFRFEFLHYSKVIERFIMPFARNLATVGIQMEFKGIDMSQYQRRIKQRQFDMIQTSVPLMPFPDERLYDFFHSESADRDGSHNLGGIKDPAVDTLIDTIATSDDTDQIRAHISALDRVLLWQHYTIPNWHSSVIRIAYWKHMVPPAGTNQYGFRLSGWWYDPDSLKARK
ncbi:extracellular solute-binding protein [Endozoicomonas montiporae]|uniref:Microcin C transport system substrate-binding protein n=1 Tax=Endozoicomonas montiporae CL-33 TaxID=570277 RepID=A0A142BD39_9GAMM|nr:extracellular solute-binding protein [Endozoicomonas montiporae]AMO56665.1 microcin C transport system substrate-binding protein [Endozoicomonas montiporae CL-33]